ncbi:hypothetical protein M413DRAFT_449956, partial [Hebeloma cylindrosporum]
VVCQFFLRGTCKFGDSCRNEHPANPQQSTFGGSSWNRNTSSAADAKITLPFNAANITHDLTPSKEKPLWPLSSYGPSKHEPLLLAGLDESPEELRVKAVAALKAGNINEYLQYESSKISNAEQIFTNARNNPDQAYQQAVQNSKLPALIAGATNPTSAFGGSSGSAFPSTSSAFGNNTTSSTTPSAFGNPTTSAFGNTSTPSAFGAKPAFGQSAFGQPAFGQTSTPGSTATTGAFGQPLNNARPVSAFSQPPQTSAFGQPAAPTSAFGQPSAFGQASSSPSSSVIKPATTGAFSAFAGAPSAFGATATTTTPAANTGGAFSAFAGQPSAFGLGAPSSTNNQGSVFGQTAFGQPTNAGAAGTTTSAFGTPVQGTGSVFGAPSAFGALNQPQQQPQQQQGAFGLGGGGTPTSAFSTNPSGTTTSVFGQNAFSNPPLSAFPPTTTTSNTGDSMSTTPIPQSHSAFNTAPAPASQPQPQPTLTPSMSISMDMKTPTTTSSSSSFSSLDFTSSNPLMSAKAKNAYKPGSTPYDQQLPERYGEMLPKSVGEAFRAVRFEWGKVPEWVPPLDV